VGVRGVYLGQLRDSKTGKFPDVRKEVGKVGKNRSPGGGTYCCEKGQMDCSVGVFGRGHRTREGFAVGVPKKLFRRDERSSSLRDWLMGGGERFWEMPGMRCRAREEKKGQLPRGFAWRGGEENRQNR